MKLEDLLPSKAGNEAIERSIVGTAKAMLEKFRPKWCECDVYVQRFDVPVCVACHRPPRKP